MAWLLSNEQVSSVVIGASKLDQLDDNIGAADLALTPAELAELNGATTPEVRYPTSVANMRDQKIADALAALPSPRPSLD